VGNNQLGYNQIRNNQVGEHKVGDKNGVYFDRAIFKLLYELGDCAQGKQISYFRFKCFYQRSI